MEEAKFHILLLNGQANGFIQEKAKAILDIEMRGHDKKLQQLFKKAAATNEIIVNEKAIKGLVLWESQCGKKLLT